MATYFFRGMIACELSLAPDGWAWVVYLGIEKDHPYFGRHFVKLDTGQTLYHVSHTLGIEALDAKWWFSFEGRRNNEDSTLWELKEASDELNKIGLTNGIGF